MEKPQHSYSHFIHQSLHIPSPQSQTPIHRPNSLASHLHQVLTKRRHLHQTMKAHNTTSCSVTVARVFATSIVVLARYSVQFLSGRIFQLGNNFLHLCSFGTFGQNETGLLRGENQWAGFVEVLGSLVICIGLLWEEDAGRWICSVLPLAFDLFTYCS